MVCLGRGGESSCARVRTTHQRDRALVPSCLPASLLSSENKPHLRRQWKGKIVFREKKRRGDCLLFSCFFLFRMYFVFVFMFSRFSAPPLPQARLLRLRVLSTSTLCPLSPLCPCSYSCFGEERGEGRDMFPACSLSIRSKTKIEWERCDWYSKIPCLSGCFVCC